MSGGPQLLGPDGKPVSAGEAPRLVDAHGRAVRAGDGAGLPERPRLRPLELTVAHDQGRDFLVARDPLGVCENAVMLRFEVLPLLQMLDGESTVEELAARAVAETGDMRHADGLRAFVADLDRLYLLESERFFARRRELAAAYRALEVREPELAGVSYPAEPDALRAFLGGHFAEARAILDAGGGPPAGAPADPVAVAVPHLDLHRAGAAIALGFLAVPAAPPPDLVFLLGTGHALYERTAALTAKTVRTPLGDLAADREAVARLAQRAGEAAFEEETAFRGEHSVEFAALYLAYRYGTHPRLVPVLCGGFHRLLDADRRPAEDPLFTALADGLRDEAAAARAAGRRVLFLAAVDLSHMGARFGDAEALDGDALEEIRRTDRDALDAAATGDAEAWFDAVAAHGDATRICGYSAVYALLRAAAPGPGTLLRYEQSVEAGGSVVTCAAMAWGAAPPPHREGVPT